MTWFGGMFWDGRATGWTLGDPLAEQAMGPFQNPLEQNMPDSRQVCIRVAHSDYAGLFEAVWGSESLNYVKDPDGTYERIVRSIAAYERSVEVNPFTSKFDEFYDSAKAAGKDITRITAACIQGGMGGMGTVVEAWPAAEAMPRTIPAAGSTTEASGLPMMNSRGWRFSTPPTGATARSCRHCGKRGNHHRFLCHRRCAWYRSGRRPDRQ